MIHLYNILKFTLMFIFQLFVTVLGWLLIPLFMVRQEEFECEHIESRPNKRFKDKWFDAIFGNREDGNDGDAPYKAKYKKLSWWTTYNWASFRNPVHNLALKMGVDDYIEAYVWKGNRHTEDRIGREGFVYSRATGVDGKPYDMYRWCKINKFITWFIPNISYYVFNPVYIIICFVVAIFVNPVIFIINLFKLNDISYLKFYNKVSIDFESKRGIELNIGYKNFNIQEVPKKYKYSFTVSINPFKKFEPRRI